MSMQNLYLATGNQLDEDYLRSTWQYTIGNNPDELRRTRLNRFVKETAFETTKLDVFVDGHRLFLFALRAFHEGKRRWDAAMLRLAKERPELTRFAYTLSSDDGVSVATFCASLLHYFVTDATERLMLRRRVRQPVVVGNDIVRALGMRPYYIPDLDAFYEWADGTPPTVVFVEPHIRIFDAYMPTLKDALAMAYRACDRQSALGKPVDKSFVEALEAHKLPMRLTDVDSFGVVAYKSKNACLDTFSKMAEWTGITVEKSFNNVGRDWYFQEKGVDVSLAIHGTISAIESPPDGIAILTVDRDYTPLLEFWKKNEIPTFLLFCPTDDGQKPTRSLQSEVGRDNVISAVEAVRKGNSDVRSVADLPDFLSSDDMMRGWKRLTKSGIYDEILDREEKRDPFRNDRWFEEEG